MINAKDDYEAQFDGYPDNSDDFYHDTEHNRVRPPDTCPSLDECGEFGRFPCCDGDGYGPTPVTHPLLTDSEPDAVPCGPSRCRTWCPGPPDPVDHYCSDCPYPDPSADCVDCANPRV